MDKTTFDPSSLSGTDRYKLLTGLVIPRPIGWVGSVGSDGVRNLAPYSYFNVVAATPPTAIFSSGRPQGAPKDTLANVIATGEFTLNIVDETLTNSMHATSERFPADVDEFEAVGLTAVTGGVVSAPMVAEAAASLECKVCRVVDLGDPATASVVFGDIVAIHVADRVLDGTRIRHDQLRAVGRIAGETYVTTADAMFEVDP